MARGSVWSRAENGKWCGVKPRPPVLGVKSTLRLFRPSFSFSSLVKGTTDPLKGAKVGVGGLSKRYGPLCDGSLYGGDAKVLGERSETRRDPTQVTRSSTAFRGVGTLLVYGTQREIFGRRIGLAQSTITDI
jgi:hypothetical protein